MKIKSMCLLAAASTVVVTLTVPVASRAAESDRVPSRVVLLSDHTTPVKTWAPLEVRVRVEAEDGTPLAGRSVRVWDDSYMRWRCCGPPPWRVTDANGEVRATLHLDGNSSNPVRVAAYWHGDGVYDSAIVEWYQPLVGYTTTVEMSHATQRTSGQTLPVTVSVYRTDPSASSSGCLDGAVVEVVLAGPTTSTATATVDHDPFAGTCRASVEFPLSITPGRYTVTASTGHAGWLRTDEPSVATGQLDLRWQHTFTDAAQRGTVFLNPVTGEYRVTLTDGRDTLVRNAGSGMTKTGVSGTVSVWRIDLQHADSTQSTTGTFYSTGVFSAKGSLGGAEWYLSS